MEEGRAADGVGRGVDPGLDSLVGLGAVAATQPQAELVAARGGDVDLRQHQVGQRRGLHVGQAHHTVAAVGADGAVRAPEVVVGAADVAALPAVGYQARGGELVKILHKAVGAVEGDDVARHGDRHGTNPFEGVAVVADGADIDAVGRGGGPGGVGVGGLVDDGDSLAVAHLPLVGGARLPGHLLAVPGQARGVGAAGHGGNAQAVDAHIGQALVDGADNQVLHTGLGHRGLIVVPARACHHRLDTDVLRHEEEQRAVGRVGTGAGKEAHTGLGVDIRSRLALHPQAHGVASGVDEVEGRRDEVDHIDAAVPGVGVGQVGAIAAAASVVGVAAAEVGVRAAAVDDLGRLPAAAGQPAVDPGAVELLDPGAVARHADGVAIGADEAVAAARGWLGAGRNRTGTGPGMVARGVDIAVAVEESVLGGAEVDALRNLVVGRGDGVGTHVELDVAVLVEHQRIGVHVGAATGAVLHVGPLHLEAVVLDQGADGVLVPAGVGVTTTGEQRHRGKNLARGGQCQAVGGREVEVGAGLEGLRAEGEIERQLHHRDARLLLVVAPGVASAVGERHIGLGVGHEAVVVQAHRQQSAIVDRVGLGVRVGVRVVAVRQGDAQRRQVGGHGAFGVVGRRVGRVARIAARVRRHHRLEGGRVHGRRRPGLVVEIDQQVAALVVEGRVEGEGQVAVGKGRRAAEDLGRRRLVLAVGQVFTRGHGQADGPLARVGGEAGDGGVVGERRESLPFHLGQHRGGVYTLRPLRIFRVVEIEGHTVCAGRALGHKGRRLCRHRRRQRQQQREQSQIS